MGFIFKENDIILFQGDSITDCSRKKSNPFDLGNGYVNLINYYIQKNDYSSSITCYNRGIYGNRTTELRRRWGRDTLALEPTILSLLVGINDTWRNFDLNLYTSPARFKANYSYLLESVKEAFPATELVLMSPFLLPIEKSQEAWLEDLNPKIEIVKELAQNYEAIYIPLQNIFNAAITLNTPAQYWSSDGVHPTPFGHILIAKNWLKYTKLR
jgi:lysophospholipase L1-like esterase